MQYSVSTGFRSPALIGNQTELLKNKDKNTEIYQLSA